jgi:hypothetical protein
MIRALRPAGRCSVTAGSAVVVRSVAGYDPREHDLLPAALANGIPGRSSLVARTEHRP